MSDLQRRATDLPHRRATDQMPPDRNLALDLVRVTEAAALQAARYIGMGDKEAADQAAVDGMHAVLDTIHMDGVVVIGEGEKDEAPMLHNGEQVGDGSPPGVDIAVDPLEGTRLCAFGIIGYTGVIDRPGEPPGEIGLGLGWFLAFAGSILMAVGGAMRAGSSERPRKPPGVL